MRTVRRLVWFLGVTALVLLAFSPLVRGPEAEEQAPSGVPEGPVALIAAEAADVPARPVLPAYADRESPRETAAAPVRLAAVPLLTSDRNGAPLTGGTWAESRYQARPPEGMFG